MLSVSGQRGTGIIPVSHHHAAGLVRVTRSCSVMFAWQAAGDIWQRRGQFLGHWHTGFRTVLRPLQPRYYTQGRKALTINEQLAGIVVLLAGMPSKSEKSAKAGRRIGRRGHLCGCGAE